jgi:hypothetical protein
MKQEKRKLCWSLLNFKYNRSTDYPTTTSPHLSSTSKYNIKVAALATKFGLKICGTAARRGEVGEGIVKKGLLMKCELK